MARSYHHGNLREALVDAAAALVGEKGATGVTLRETARRAGVTHSAPYRHFADKEALLAAVAEAGFRELGEDMERAFLQPAANRHYQFQAMGRAYARFAADHPALYRLMFGAQIPDRSVHPTLASAVDACNDVLIRAIEHCQETGEIAPGDARQMGAVAWAQVHGLCTLMVDGQFTGTVTPGETDPERLADLATSRLYKGLAPRSEPG